MAETSPRRLYLADLVAAVLLCGGLAALFASGRNLGHAEPYLTFLIVVFIGWNVIRSWRNAPRCEECGQKFTPSRTTGPVIDCPHCGGRQAGLARSLKGRNVLFWAMTPIIALSASAAMILATDASRAGEPLEGARKAGVLIAAGLAGLAILSMGWSGVSRARLARPSDRPCEACREVIPAERPVPRICPNCQAKRADRAQAEKEQALGIRKLRFIVGAMGLAVVVFLVMTFHSMSRSGNWSGLAVALLPTLLVLLFVGWLSVGLIRSRKSQALITDAGLLAKARECTGEEGTVVQEGQITVWYSGPEDPTPMLREEIADSHRRFESLLGEAGIVDPPIRIVCFQDRGALLRFYREAFPGADLSAYQGIYFQRPFRILVLCTAAFPGRLDDPRSQAGSLYDLVLMEHVYGTLPASWVQAGLARALGAWGRQGEAARLHRKMIAAIAAGDEWSEELFSTSANRFSRMLSRSREAKSAHRAEQFTEQSGSIVDYLCGEKAPDARRAAFRAFVKDVESRSRQEESFFRHLGFGFGSLLDAWREWVFEQGIGPDEPPPLGVRDALVDRVLPVIRDPRAGREDRVRAIRDWRKAGYVLGAGALIDLLRDPGDIPKAELLWALRGVSGMAWGDEPDRWQLWWDELARLWRGPISPEPPKAEDLRVTT